MEAPDSNRTYCVYKHTLPDGRYYVGATYRGEKRWGENGCHYKSSKLFFPLIKQFGWNNIKHEILFSELSSKEAREKEQELIELAQESGLSLNIVKGGYNIIQKGQMHEIVGLRTIGLSYPEISRIYNVHPDAIAAIVKNKRYLTYYSEEEFTSMVSLFVSENRGKYQRQDGLTPNHNGHLAKRIIKKDVSGNIVERYESITVAANENAVLVSSIANNLKGLSRLCGGYKYEYE